MRYRWKLMILLLVIALVPLGTMRMVGIRGVRLLSNELVSRARKNLSRQATDRLQLIVESYAQMLRQGRQQLEIALIFQAGEVEHHLAGPVEELTDGVYFAKNFGPQRILPRGLVTTLDHFRIIADNKVELLKVTYASQVFNAAPGVKLENVKSDIARLAGMTLVYHRLSDYLKDLVIWQYTALRNGLYSVYPGHDSFPAAYDPRDQPWYRQAFMGRGYWTDQFIDAQTGRQVVAVSMPVTGPHGKTAGATALIMPIRNFLEQRLLLENIPPQTRAFVVYPAIRPQTGRRGARIMVREDPDDSRHRWRTPLTTDWLNADDQDQFQAVLDDFENGRSNIRRMHFNGCDCLWVYGAIHEKTFLVLVTPSAAIFEPALRSEEYIQIQIQQLLDLTNYGIAGILVVIVILALPFHEPSPGPCGCWQKRPADLPAETSIPAWISERTTSLVTWPGCLTKWGPGWRKTTTCASPWSWPWRSSKIYCQNPTPGSTAWILRAEVTTVRKPVEIITITWKATATKSLSWWEMCRAMEYLPPC